LNQILTEKKLSLIAVAGTHGKTTTTGMLVWALKELGVTISYSIGTSLTFGPPAQYQDGSEYFIYECDEFDRNFLQFHPFKSLITSFDYDHPDTYPTPEDYKYAFLDFVNQSNMVYLWNDAAGSLGLVESSNISIVSKHDPGVNQLKLHGEASRQDAWLAAQCINDLLPSRTLPQIVSALNTFPGTNRRFEKLSENLYTDYGHHPVEIAATIKMALEVNPNVVVIYQPHQNIRQHELMREGGYKDCLKGAKQVYWLPTFLSREYQDLEILSQQTLIESTSDPKIVETAQLDDALWQKIQKHLKDGDLVVAMSAGDLDHWLRQRV
jgi:UDP-N-acetylmuramate--alanine ligase